MNQRQMHTKDAFHRGGRRGQEGVALILALVFIVLLTVLVTSYLYETQVDASVAGNSGVHFQALLAAKSGVAEALARLAEDVIEEQAAGVPAPGYDTRGEGWHVDESGPEHLEPLPVNEALALTFINDEYGKLNLNALVNANGEVNRPLAEVLQYLLDARSEQPVSVDPIIDWIDADSSPHGDFGAEADYYEGVGLPYRCKDAPFDGVEELMLVAGITSEVFYGRRADDTDRNFLPLTELLTVYGHPEGAVNINTAPAELVAAIVWQRELPRSDVDAIIKRQDDDPFLSEDDLIRAGLMEEERDDQGDERPPRIQTLPLITFSHVFRIHSYGVLGDAVQRVEAYVWRDKDPAYSEYTEFFRFFKWSVTQ